MTPRRDPHTVSTGRSTAGERSTLSAHDDDTLVVIHTPDTPATRSPQTRAPADRAGQAPPPAHRWITEWSG